MKPYTIVLCLLCLPFAVISQTTEYFTADWKKTKNKDKATYYRIIRYTSDGQPTGVVNDYYMTGQLQWKGVILSIDKKGNETRQGWCTWLYPNGSFQQQSFYRQGLLDSTTYYWNENGDLTGQEDYRQNVLHGAWIRYFPNKKPRLVAVYENGALKDGLYLEYDENDIPAAIYPEWFTDATKWTLYNSNDYSAALKDKKLWLNSRTGKFRALGYKYLPLTSTGNFSIETTVSIEKSSNNFKSHGIIWGAKDASNYDYFVISDDGRFSVGYLQQGVDVSTVKWTASPAIKTGKATNALKVIKIGAQYTFAVNGQVVATSNFLSLMGDYAGATIASGVENIAFERFIVQQVAADNSGGNDNQASVAVEWNVSGSGILIDKNGFIATNEHVIAGAKAIEVEFTKDNKKYTFKAEIVKADAGQDLAILKINDTRYASFKPAALPYSISNKLLDIGSSVFALGYPEIMKLGTNIKFTDGKISAQTGSQDNPYWYQITVPIQHGNSGGPLFDNDGNLVGLTNAGFLGTMENVAYAIKSELLLKLLTNSFPGKYIPPVNTLKDKPLTEKIKLLKPYVTLIKAKI
ncbi:MAG: hypothetical protein DI535_09420 [Citrobacter freundii]|nr:MAG: hypothetical protein DI535_09420 [Citrobacter freundii]